MKFGGGRRSGLLSASHDGRLGFILSMVMSIFRRDFSKNSGDKQVSLDFSSVGIQSVELLQSNNPLQSN